MPEPKKILQLTLALLLDVLVLACQMVRQVILPRKGRKGNVLTTLFLFFTGLIEKIIAFEQALIPKYSLSKKKYVRLGVLLVAWLLFALSSFEWADPTSSSGTAFQNFAANSGSNRYPETLRKAENRQIKSTGICPEAKTVRPTAFFAFSGRSLPLFSAKKYLRNRVLRI